MISKRSIYYIFALGFFLTACQNTAEKETAMAEPTETIEVAEVNISSKAEDNLQTANDVSAFNFKELVTERLNITDTAIINDISWSTIPSKDGKGAKIQLVLGANALPRKTELESLFKTFSQQKLAEYEVKNAELPIAEAAAISYLQLIQTSTIDTIWLKTSSTLTKFASKDDFNRTLLQRKELFHPEGIRKIVSRRVSNLLGDAIKGEFCTITFAYENGVQEEVTLEKINGVYKLLGYHFVVIPK